MKKLLFGAFLIAGTTFAFASTTENITDINKVITINNGKEYKITTINYSEDGEKCTLSASYNDGNGNYGTITVTAATCTRAAMIISNMLAQGEN